MTMTILGTRSFHHVAALRADDRVRARRRASARRVASIALVASMLAACFFDAPAFAQTAFYSTQGIDVDAYPPGALIRSQAMDRAPDGASAFRVLYASTGIHGERIAVSGAVIVPDGAPPPGGRPIVAWAHPTSGIEDRCAPSLAWVFFSSVQGLDDMLHRGFAVAATDYPGLGTAGIHPYLVGDSEAHAVIDSVRVARTIAGVGDARRFAVWGHSQGGQAALFTGLDVGTYAPELDLVGIAAAAPATDLPTLLADDANTSGGRNITAMTLWSWSRLYDAPLTNVVAPQAIPVIDKLAGECIERFFDMFERIGPTRALAKTFLLDPDFASKAPWHALLVENSARPTPPSIPVFLAQGSKDGLVLPAVTEHYRDTLCANGSVVAWDLLVGGTHGFAGRDAAPAAVAWIADRFAGNAPPNDCPR
jgi:alpha-beta hydrolase superfamily lysophospholipase